MRRLLITTLLLVTMLSLGQVSIERRSAFFKGKLVSSAIPIPPAIANGIAYWWVSSDVTTNTTVSSWTDRIQGVVSTNGDSATRPTNSSSGMHFQGTLSQRLTNAPLNILNAGNADTNTHFFVISLDSAGFQDILANDPASSSPAIGFNGTPALYYFQTPTLAADGAIPTATLMDVAVVSSSGAGHSTPQLIFYTNGVPSNTNAVLSVQGGWQSIGGDSGNGFLKAFVKEILIYTNNLDASQIANVHKYATNTYGYSP